MLSNIKNEKKTAIILLNLGGPNKPQEIKKILFNLFYDPAIMRLPNPFRWLIAKLISNLRQNKAKKIYELIGGKSPIYDETLKQAVALKNFLTDKAGLSTFFEIYICMRHFYPMASDIVPQLSAYNPDEIILVPLYPQFSTTTTGSSIKECIEVFQKAIFNAKIKTICCYPVNQDFIEAHTKLIIDSISQMKNSAIENYRILFSAHSLPVKIIAAGDPYQWQIIQTVNNIVDNLAIDNLDYVLSYQSKVGPIEWLSPSTEDEIIKAGETDKSLIVVPIAFVSEHVETLVELDIEYKAIASKYGITYLRVPTISINKSFIKTLGETVVRFSKHESEIIASDNLSRVCPKNFTACPCRIIN